MTSVNLPERGSDPTIAFSSISKKTSLPQAVPVKSRVPTSYLPSSSIDKSSLMPVEHVNRKYLKLKGESKAGKLAVKLAKEASFGDKVLVQCTVSSC